MITAELSFSIHMRRQTIDRGSPAASSVLCDWDKFSYKQLSPFLRLKSAAGSSRKEARIQKFGSRANAIRLLLIRRARVHVCLCAEAATHTAARAAARKRSRCSFVRTRSLSFALGAAHTLARRPRWKRKKALDRRRRECTNSFLYDTPSTNISLTNGMIPWAAARTHFFLSFLFSLRSHRHICSSFFPPGSRRVRVYTFFPRRRFAASVFVTRTCSRLGCCLFRFSTFRLLRFFPVFRSQLCRARRSGRNVCAAEPTRQKSFDFFLNRIN